ncbi:MAG: hypothetical protein RQ761_04460 [Bacteroidales bacterium]|nr:hypothetical protein [Bacteroidales bacterium]
MEPTEAGSSCYQYEKLIDGIIILRKGLFLMEGMWTRFIPATEVYLELMNKKSNR